MQEISIRECKTLEEIESTYPIMRQLRPHVTLEEYYPRIFGLIKEERFRLFAAYDNNNQCVGVVGFQPSDRLSLGKIIYIADLVTDETHRSRGIGSLLLNRVKQEAKQQGIDAIVLDSGLQRKKAHEFYNRHGYKSESYSFRLFKPFNNNIINTTENQEPIINMPGPKL